MDNDIEYSDDLVPNDAGSSMFEAPVDGKRKQEEVAEESMVLAATPLYDNILSWFDEAIAAAKSIESINPESRIPVSAQVLARQQYLFFLESGRHQLVEWRNQYVGEK